MAYEYLLQLCLSITVLSSPAAPPPGLFKLVHRPIVSICIHCQIMDAREVKYILVDPADFVRDIQILKIRADSLQDCPLVESSVLFPDIGLTNEFILFNREYYQYLKMCLTIHVNDRFFIRAKEDTEYLHLIWNAARDAKREFYYIHIRRRALGLLLRELGPENFWSGSLPPHIPIWSLTAIRH